MSSSDSEETKIIAIRMKQYCVLVIANRVKQSHKIKYIFFYEIAALRSQ